MPFIGCQVTEGAPPIPRTVSKPSAVAWCGLFAPARTSLGMVTKRSDNLMLTHPEVQPEARPQGRRPWAVARISWRRAVIRLA